MSAPRLSLDDARSFEVPCTWTREGGETIPAVLVVSRDRGGWWVSVTPEGWATLWLSSIEVPPWGSWRTHGAPKDDRKFDTAQAAVDAAFATPQIGAPE